MVGSGTFQFVAAALFRGRTSTVASLCMARFAPAIFLSGSFAPFSQFRRKSLASLVGLIVAICLTGSAFAQKYVQVNLVSDIPGTAVVTDQNLVNPWGIANGPTSPFWINENGTGRSALFAKDGTFFAQLRSVRIPPPHGSIGSSAPRGRHHQRVESAGCFWSCGANAGQFRYRFTKIGVRTNTGWQFHLCHQFL